MMGIINTKHENLIDIASGSISMQLVTQDFQKYITPMPFFVNNKITFFFKIKTSTQFLSKEQISEMKTISSKSVKIEENKLMYQIEEYNIFLKKNQESNELLFDYLLKKN
jgi:hypothetical protein